MQSNVTAPLEVTIAKNKCRVVYQNGISKAVYYYPRYDESGQVELVMVNVNPENSDDLIAIRNMVTMAREQFPDNCALEKAIARFERDVSGLTRNSLHLF